MNTSETKTNSQLAREMAILITENQFESPEYFQSVILARLNKATSELTQRNKELEALLRSYERTVDSYVKACAQYKDNFTQAQKEKQELEENAARWKTGCLANADDAKDCHERSDKRRLENIQLQKELAAKDEALKKAFLLIDTEYTFRRHSPIWEMIKGCEIRDTVEQALSTKAHNYISLDDEVIVNLADKLSNYVREDGHNSYCKYDINGVDPDTDFCICNKSNAKALSAFQAKKGVS